MAVWSYVTSQEATRRGRWDAEYYQPHYLKFQHRLEQDLARGEAFRLGDLATVEYGYMPMQDYVDAEDGEPLLRVTNLKGGLDVDYSDLKYVPKGLGIPDKKRLKANDVLLVQCGDTTGKVGFVGVEHEGMLFPSFCLAIRSKGEVTPDLLALFMECDIGQVQLQQRVTLATVRPNTTKPDVEALIVPAKLLTDEAGSVQAVLDQRNKARALYAEAEAILHDALGLDALDTGHTFCYEGTFADMAQAERMDAEYFQPRYQRALALLGTTGQRIQDVAHLAKRPFQQKLLQEQVKNADKTFQYIEIGSVNAGGDADSESVAYREAPSRAQWIVNTGDVLTSTVRPIRRLTALIRQPQNEFVCSSGFAVLQPFAIRPEVLLVYLRLPLVCELLDLFTTATMYPSLAVDDLLDMPITVPSEAVQATIAAKVNEAYTARQEAGRLLTEAKQRVEALIVGDAAA